MVLEAGVSLTLKVGGNFINISPAGVTIKGTMVLINSGGAAGSWAMTNLAPRALADNFAPGFYVKHILKDIRIAVESARELGLDVPGMRGAHELYDRVAALGWEEFGTQVLYRLYTTQ